jgi:CheY-like chemotaxis protein
MVASNAFEGLELIKNPGPDLVLSGIKMPGMDGFELLAGIRASGTHAGGSVPIIAMSAFFSQTDRARKHYAVFQACLPKPFTPDELVETIWVFFKPPPNRKFLSLACIVILQVHLAGIKGPVSERF